MRKKFEQQLSVGIIPIASVKIPEYKRDELHPTLLALQYIFITQELNQQLFSMYTATRQNMDSSHPNS